jgi:hypothetical protein
MAVLQAIRCKLRWHSWGPITGDSDGGGARQECVHCGRSKPADPKGPNYQPWHDHPA